MGSNGYQQPRQLTCSLVTSPSDMSEEDYCCAGLPEGGFRENQRRTTREPISHELRLERIRLNMWRKVNQIIRGHGTSQQGVVGDHLLSVSEGSQDPASRDQPSWERMKLAAAPETAEAIREWWEWDGRHQRKV